jgi:hypothetical protein
MSGLSGKVVSPAAFTTSKISSLNAETGARDIPGSLQAGSY